MCTCLNVYMLSTSAKLQKLRFFKNYNLNRITPIGILSRMSYNCTKGTKKYLNSLNKKVVDNYNIERSVPAACMYGSRTITENSFGFKEIQFSLKNITRISLLGTLSKQDGNATTTAIHTIYS
jgi:hypothetical protein